MAYHWFSIIMDIYYWVSLTWNGPVLKYFCLIFILVPPVTFTVLAIGLKETTYYSGKAIFCVLAYIRAVHTQFKFNSEN
jgi:hypothetical protein